MTSKNRVVAIALTYLGALPFWLFMLLSIFAPQIEARRSFVAYGAIIASFMAGTVWRSALNGRPGIFILLSSNVLALGAFATLLIEHSALGLLAQIILFGLLLAADAWTIAGYDDLRWYLKLRGRVTLIVLAAYCFMLAFVR